MKVPPNTLEENLIDLRLSIRYFEEMATSLEEMAEEFTKQVDEFRDELESLQKVADDLDEQFLKLQEDTK